MGFRRITDRVVSDRLIGALRYRMCDGASGEFGSISGNLKDFQLVFGCLTEAFSEVLYRVSGVALD